MNTTNVEDPYRILGIAHDASDAEIRKAYQKLARKYHPDRQSNNNTNDNDKEETINHEEKMAEINAAYEILKDPDQKREFDRLYRLGAFGNDDRRDEMRQRRQRGTYQYREQYNFPGEYFPSEIGRTFPNRPPSTTTAASYRNNNQFNSTMSSNSGGFTMSYTSTKNDARTGVRQVIQKTTRFNNGKKFTYVESTSYFPDGRTEHNVSTHEEENASVFGYIVKSMLGLSTEPKPKPKTDNANTRSNVVHEDEAKNVPWYHQILDPMKKCVGMK